MPDAAHHHRAPSLGELHQELEQEQEAQVNRLLHMIRQQHNQLRGLPAADGGLSTAIDDSTPNSETSFTFSSHPPPTAPNPSLRSPAIGLSRQASRRSRASSRGTGSPAQRPTSAGYVEISEHGFALPAPRDEAAFYQAETQMLTRENQMLKKRIRELERQVTERDSTPPASAGSPLARVASGESVPAPPAPKDFDKSPYSTQ
ncbi:MAG: hypothetical protein M1829_002148 [Trizodia sp. TS-e1964]|nr:MAG: hypothetical protein M1829_002148 [Trizodia sp. TS-e1964]